MGKSALQSKILDARNKLVVAEQELDTAMRALPGGARADKIAVSEALRRAFEDLRAAREDLAELLKLVEEDS